MRLINGHSAKKLIHKHNPGGKMLRRETVMKLLDSLPEIDPVHAAGGCYCIECKYQEDCERYVIVSKRSLVLEQNITSYNTLGWCSYGRRREGTVRREADKQFLYMAKEALREGADG